MKRPGDNCETCPPGKPKERLILVNGALVCPACGNVRDWPKVRRGEAEVRTR